MHVFILLYSLLFEKFFALVNILQVMVMTKAEKHTSFCKVPVTVVQFRKYKMY
jgi:hypothetical protein